MTKTTTMLAATAAIALGAIMADGAAAFEKRNFTYTTWITDKLGHSKAAMDFMNAVEKRTDGAVTFEVFWSGALCGAVDALECLVTGQADIAFGSAVYNPAEMPLTTVASIPFQNVNGQAGADAMMDLIATDVDLKAEWDRNNVHLLFFGHTSLPLLGSTKQITTLADMKGKSIRTVGHGVSAMQKLGANPVATAPAEQYEALQRGVLDGAIYSVDGMIDARLYEVVDYIYDIGEFMGNYAMLYTAMGKDTWDSLSPELQQVFTEEAVRISKSYGKDFIQPYEVEACKTLAGAVDVIAPFGDHDSAVAWQKEMRDFTMEKWMQDVEKAGVTNAAGMRDLYRDTVARHDKGDVKPGNQICLQAAASK